MGQPPSVYSKIMSIPQHGPEGWIRVQTSNPASEVRLHQTSSVETMWLHQEISTADKP